MKAEKTCRRCKAKFYPSLRQDQEYCHDCHQPHKNDVALKIKRKKNYYYDSKAKHERYVAKRTDYTVSEIHRIGELLNVPQKIRELVMQYCQKAYQHKLLYGYSMNAIIAALVYYACLAEKCPLTLSVIVKKSNNSMHDVKRCYVALVNKLCLPSLVIDPKLLVHNVIVDLGFPHNVETKAINIISEHESRHTLSGADPKGWVAAAIYVAAICEKLKCNQMTVAKTVGVTDVTLRCRIKDFGKKFLRSFYSSS